MDLWQTKGGVLVSPRTGRPTDNPKPDRITVRLDNASMEILVEYCENNQVERAEAIRRAIKMLKEK